MSEFDFGSLKPKKTKPIAPEKLHPPKPIKTKKAIPKSHKKIEDTFFVELANSSEFKRFIYKVLYGKVHRTEKQHGNLDQKVKEGLEVVRVIGRGNSNDKKELIKELKEVLGKRKTKIEN